MRRVGAPCPRVNDEQTQRFMDANTTQASRVGTGAPTLRWYRVRSHTATRRDAPGPARLHQPATAARFPCKSRHCTFPVADFGSVSQNSTMRGLL